MAQKGQGGTYLRITVSSNSAAIFTCPNCGLSRRKDVSRFLRPEKDSRIKCKCSCRCSFRVILERWQPPEEEAVFQDRQVKWVVKRRNNAHNKDLLMLLSIFLILLISVFYLAFNGPSDASPKRGSFTSEKGGDVIRSIYDN